MSSRFSSYYEKFADGKVVCIDEEIPFEIPESWQWERWGNLSYSIQYGYNAPAEETGDIRMVRISDIQHGDVLWATVPFCHINESEIDTYLLQKDDILFARTGGTVGKSFLVKDVPYPSIYAGYLIRTRYSNMLSAQYMKYFMECELYWEQLRNGTIATAQPNCNGKTLAKMILPIPPYNEQIRITDKLNQVLEQVRRYGESQDRLDKLNIQIHDLLKKSILQEAIQGRLVAQEASDEPASVLLQRIKEEKLHLVKEGKLKKKDVIDSTIFRGDDNKYYEQIGKTVTDISEEIPFNIPDKWAWSRLSGVVNIIMGQSPDGNDVFEADKVNDAYEFHQGKISFTDKYIAPSGKWCRKPPRIADIGSLLVCVRAPIGDVNITQRQIGIGRGLAAITGYKGIAPDFLFYWLLAHKRLLIDKGTGSTFKAITVEILKDLIIPLPPLVEQQRIVSQIKKLYDRIKGI